MTKIPAKPLPTTPCFSAGTRPTWLSIAFLGLCVLAPHGAANTLPLTFTDNAITLPCADGEWAWSLRTITRSGWGPVKQGISRAENGIMHVEPLTEGIHILEIDTEPPSQRRFLAITPPSPIDESALRETLPQSADKLLNGAPLTLLAMGDSVIATGDMATMLGMLLARATGNANIAVVKRAYPGRSVDAAVRFFAADTVEPTPDIGLLMYGLNDQGAGTSLAGYTEQYRWIGERLRSDCGADPVFLTPTPDLSRRQADEPYSAYVFRTIGFVHAVLTLGHTMDIPVADVFQGLWGEGQEDIHTSARRLQPLYPLHFRKPGTSLLEADGIGDGVHPNALGHLMLARTVFETLTRLPDASPPRITATSFWTADGLFCDISISNRATTPQQGILTVYPFPGYGLAPEPALAYVVPPQDSATVTIKLSSYQTPADLLSHPANLYLEAGDPIVAILDQRAGHCRIQAIPAPFSGPRHRILRARSVVENHKAFYRIQIAGRIVTNSITLPNQPAGRIALAHSTNGHTAVAELGFVRYAHAQAREATVDGDVAEWNPSEWIDISDPVHARWTSGPSDFRATPEDCRIRWAIRAGSDGVYVAIDAQGHVETDMFTLFFDPRSPHALGTPGPYYWLSGALRNGSLRVSGGETSPRGLRIANAMQSGDKGYFIELCIPWALMDSHEWPKTDDLGFSFWWRHNGKDGVTHLQWSEDGHPWNTRWYGVVRRGTDMPTTLPAMVRIK